MRTLSDEERRALVLGIAANILTGVIVFAIAYSITRARRG